MTLLKQEYYSKIYNILVAYFGAYERDRPDFIYYLCEEHEIYEWRFGGNLGSGGKFHKNGHMPVKHYVSCYAEDINPKRQALIAEANKAIQELDLLKK